MSRLLRIHAIGLPVHVVQRGNNHQQCFFTVADYHFFLDCLGRGAKRFECDLHAYVLMTNHVHLLLTSHLARGVSLLMKQLGQCYTQYVNRSYGRSGTLWEGRFRSSLVRSRSYVLACYRYIEMNPVRARMVCHPAEYAWSSYLINAHGHQSWCITPHGEYLGLGREGESRYQAYRCLFSENFDPDLLDKIRSATRGGRILERRRGRISRVELAASVEPISQLT